MTYASAAMVSKPYGGWNLSGYQGDEEPEQVVSLLTTGAVVLAAFACIGTGGNTPAQFWVNQSYGYRLVEHSYMEPARSWEQYSPVQQLGMVREVFRPAMAELAAVFGITRQAVYGWLSGEKQPSVENAAKLDDLSAAAGRLLEAGFAASQVGKRKVADGRTILQIAQHGGSALQAADLLIATLSSETVQRARMAARLSGRQLVPADVPGIPSYAERA